MTATTSSIKNLPKPVLTHIPGDFGIPFFGDTFKFLKDPIRLFKEKQSKYGNVFKMQFLGTKVVCLIGQEANRFVLVEQGKYFSNEQGWDFSIGELFAGGLMLKDGEDHKHHRSILQEAFKKNPIADYLQVMIPPVSDYLDSWKDKKQITVFQEMKKLTLQLAGKVFFGVDFSKDLSFVNQAIINVVKASTTAIPFPIPFTPYWNGLRARKTLEKYFHKLIEEKRKNPAKDMLGILCLAENEEGDRLSDQEIVDHLIFILMASHDTTASTMTSLFYELSVNPEWQEKLRAESQDFYKNHEMTYQNQDFLPLLDLAIKETLRLHPPLILMPRMTTKALDFTEFTIPANTRITLYINHTHYEEEIWKDANLFNPGRFAETQAEHKKCPHAYMPFGGGKHFCLGFGFAEMQMKLIISKVLCQYKWELPKDYVMGYKSIPIQEPKGGLPMMIRKLG